MPPELFHELKFVNGFTKSNGETYIEHICIIFSKILSEDQKKILMRMTEKKHVILTNIDTELWAKFKGTCYTHGQSMNEVVSRLIKSYINKKS